MEIWDHRFLELCRFISAWSKDPSTKCGAVIVRPDHTIVSLGYNGFPRGIRDTAERLNNRALKYEMVIHAEMSAILSAPESVAGCTLYVTPYPPCARCAVHIIQAKIIKVIAPMPANDKLVRWGDSFELAQNLFAEAGVCLKETCEIK